MKNNRNNRNREYTSLEDVLLENEALQERNQFLANELIYFKTRCSDMAVRCSELSERNLELESEIADMKFTRKYLTSEEAGRAFARSLLGGK